MDPTVAREAMMKITARLESAVDEGYPPPTADVEALLLCIRALDTWLCQGGRLPAPWAEPAPLKR